MYQDELNENIQKCGSLNEFTEFISENKVKRVYQIIQKGFPFGVFGLACLVNEKNIILFHAEPFEEEGLAEVWERYVAEKEITCFEAQLVGILPGEGHAIFFIGEKSRGDWMEEINSHSPEKFEVRYMSGKESVIFDYIHNDFHYVTLIESEEWDRPNLIQQMENQFGKANLVCMDDAMGWRNIVMGGPFQSGRRKESSPFGGMGGLGLAELLMLGGPGGMGRF